jgi:hypothetical protein
MKIMPESRYLTIRYLGLGLGGEAVGENDVFIHVCSGQKYLV